MVVNMPDIDITPIHIATAALNIFYPDHVFSTQTHLAENHKSGTVYVAISNEMIGTFHHEILLPIQGVQDSIEFGDYIRDLLIAEGILPVVPPLNN